MNALHKMSFTTKGLKTLSDTDIIDWHPIHNKFSGSTDMQMSQINIIVTSLEKLRECFGEFSFKLLKDCIIHQRSKGVIWEGNPDVDYILNWHFRDNGLFNDDVTITQ